MGLRIYQVDAFADRPFAGNPAAVCLLREPREDAWMQALGAEMNLSETAFLMPEGDGFRLRWFTPTVEVDLCGHATLASAHVLWQIGKIPADAPARFTTRSGLLTCVQRDGWIEMDFPAKPPQTSEAPAGLLESLGVSSRYVGNNQFDYLVEVESESVVRGIHPDFLKLAKVSARGVIVTARSDSPAYDFVSRFFAPAVGIDEDPATGSAHCCLGPFWSARLDKSELTAYQASARGGVVRTRMNRDRVVLSGQAVTVLVGELADA